MMDFRLAVISTVTCNRLQLDHKEVTVCKQIIMTRNNKGVTDGQTVGATGCDREQSREQPSPDMPRTVVGNRVAERHFQEAGPL